MVRLPRRKCQDVRRAFGLGASPRPFWATAMILRNKNLRCVSFFKTADISTSVRISCSASMGVTVATS
jgi:hypothetical protein